LSPSWLIIAVIPTLVTGRSAAQVPSVRVDSSSAQLEVTFPTLPLSQSGCRFVANVPGATGRSYSWRVWASYRYPQYPINHFFRLEFEFHFPDDIELTEARFDSIAAEKPIKVSELHGEPPMFGTDYPLDQASLDRDSASVRVFIQGREAVDALLRTRVDSVAVSWCERNSWPPTIRVVRLERH
jgi:hypothetical protein